MSGTRTASPTLVRVRVLLVAAGLCLVMVVAVLLGSVGPGPLDQPDRAEQRNGLVLGGPTVPPSVAGVRLRSVPSVLLFVRRPPPEDTLARWRRALPSDASVTVVVQAPGEAQQQPVMSPPVDVVIDPEQELAMTVDLPEPIDGGPGVGYAIVDTDGVVRYSTLDPAWPDNAFEVTTMLGAAS